MHSHQDVLCLVVFEERYNYVFWTTANTGDRFVFYVAWERGWAGVILIKRDFFGPLFLVVITINTISNLSKRY